MEEKLIKQLIESVKKNRKGLNCLKDTAIICRQYELAKQLSDIEKLAFPETEEIKLAKGQAKKLKFLFSMIKMDVSEPACWLIAETLKRNNEKKGDFSMNDAIELCLKKEEIFFT